MVLKIEPDPVPPPFGVVTFIVATVGETFVTIELTLPATELGAPRVTPVLFVGHVFFVAA
ncbi:unannotated protein [freshwater metagenome]|uniref:Unannotated protein n=1 Tax=freshwater metagenome TaxID=449393 RepID=A0A6J6GP12_9ZZZZ